MKGEKELIENEWYMVRHSGEIPEVAFHSALYYLSRDKQGPCLQLENVIVEELKLAARDRFLDIIKRDLDPDNREKTVYRGLARGIVNWSRFKHFCERQQLSWRAFIFETSCMLRSFLEREVAECRGGKKSCINCSHEDLITFAKELGITPEKLPQDVNEYCDPGNIFR